MIESTLRDTIEKLNSISNNEYYLYQKSQINNYPIILEIKGNINTPYEGGVFNIEINSDKFHFITKICSIFININTGELKDKKLIIDLENIIKYIKNEILISPNTTEIIEKDINNWPGKEVYYKYLSTIKSYTQKYANKDGIKIKIDNNLLSNNDFSKYKNLKEITNKYYKRVKNEFKNEVKYISKAKSSLGINIENIYFCPFNNFSQIYFEFLGFPGTPYEGGVFQFLYEISPNYPFGTGKCVFRTQIFHNKFNGNTSNICDIEFSNFFNLSLSLYYICLYYYKMMNQYNYICFENKEARYLIYNNFKEYLKKVKHYTKNYSNLEGIKFKSDLKLIENPSEKLNIEPPIEPDFMPKIKKEYDNNIKEEEINIFAITNFTNGFLLKIKNTDFVVDICLKIREYIIKYRDYIRTTKSYGLNIIDDYKNLLPRLYNKGKDMDYNKQIGHYGIKNDDKIKYIIGIPTCYEYYK